MFCSASVCHFHGATQLIRVIGEHSQCVCISSFPITQSFESSLELNDLHDEDCASVESLVECSASDSSALQNLPPSPAAELVESAL